MVYLQEDIFTKNFFVKYKDKNGIEKNPLVIHYGFTDNLLLAIILNWVNLWNWKQIFLPHILMPYHVFFTSDNIRKFWYDIEKIKKLWFRVKFLNTFDFWDSRNKKIIKSINNYNPYIHIKWKNNWEYIYRILWENTWRENNFDNVILDLKNEFIKRRNFLNENKEKILKERIKIDVETIEEINNFINNWFILDIFLENTNENILNFERNLKWWEILWFRKNLEEWKCIDMKKNLL